MLYRSSLRLFGAFAAILLILSSCASTSPSGAQAAAADALEGDGSRLPGVAEGEDVPSWIETYPSDEDYYIGIGGFAGSEDRAELLERGRLSAMRALASEISTEIRSELRAVTREDSRGESYDSTTAIMNAMVEEELQGVEVVDSYYSDGMGQWFYLRLSKEEFRRYQQAEIAQLETRLEALLEPVAGNPDVTAAAELATLFRALAILAESPYGGEAAITIAGSEGFAADAIVTRIQAVLDGLRLRPRRRTVSTLPGAPATLEIDADTPGRPAGAGRIPLSVAGAAGRQLTVTADEAGTSRATLATDGLDPGTYGVTARLALDELLDSEESPRVDVAVPETTLDLEVRALTVLLSVRSADGERLPGMEGFIRELISERIPVSFADAAADSDGRLTFTVQHRELPENEYGLVFVFAHAVLDARRDGVNVASYRTAEVKEGGLDADQALSRAVTRLQDHLAEDAEFERTLRSFIEG